MSRLQRLGFAGGYLGRCPRLLHCAPLVLKHDPLSTINTQLPAISFAFTQIKEAREQLAVVTVNHLTMEELEAGLDEIRNSPADEGVLELIVRRPQIGEREILEKGELHLTHGLVGDNWSQRPSSRTLDGSPHPDMQLNVMNARAIALFAQQRDRWPLAGDQLFLDLDLSPDNLPPGTRLALGSAVIVVTNQPHTGCRKFLERFGSDALRFVSSPVGKELNLRGINAKVVQPGMIRVGCQVKKI